MLRIICEEEPPKPSTRLSSSQSLPSIAAQRQLEPRKLTTLVAGELDWIVMKAIEKDRTRRYETANGFARDIQRYLADEPVEACPPTAGYRLRKFARRNKGPLAVAATMLLLLVVLGSGFGWVVQYRAARDAAAAQQLHERQARVTRQVESIFREMDRLEKEQKWPEALEAIRRADAAMASGEAYPATAERVHQRLKELEFVDRLERTRIESSVGSFSIAIAEREYARAFLDFGVDVNELPVEISIGRLKTRPALTFVLAAALDDWAFDRRLLAESDVGGWKRLVTVARGIDPDPLRDQFRAAWGRPIAEAHDDLRRLADSIDVRALDPATLVNLARSLKRAQHIDAALRLLQNAQRVHPGDFFLNFELGELLYGQNDVEGSIRFYTAAAAIRPRSFFANNNLGVSLFAQKKLDEAIRYYRKATEVDPKNVMAHNNLGIALLGNGAMDEAVAEFKEVIKLAPTALFGYQNLDLALQSKGSVDEAIAEWTKVIERDPKNARGHTWLGLALKRKGNLEEAYTEFRKAIEVDPKFDLGWDCLFRALQFAGRRDVAIAQWKKMIELDPKDFRAHNYLARTLQGYGRVDDAIAEWNKVIELDPSFVGARNSIGLALLKKGRVDEAIAVYRKAIELTPAFAKTHVNLADALRSKGQLDEAIATLHKAVGLQPELAEAYPVMSGLAVDCAAQGRPTDALRLINELLATADQPGRSPSTDSVTVVSCIQHFRSLGDLTSCRVAAEALEKKNLLDSTWLYNAARGRAIIAAAQMHAGDPNAARLSKEEADRAMVWLSKAVAAGFAEAILMRHDADLDPLRDRDDFHKLLADVEAKATPVGLARSYILLSQWDRAAAEYAKANLLARPLDENAVAYACLFLIRGDDEGYNRFCHDIIRRVAQTKAPSPYDPYILARTCAIAHKSAVDPARAVQWANQAVGSSRQPWYYHVLGLAQYRAGQFDQALKSFTQANVETWRYADLNWFALALVHHRLGHPDEARYCLDKGVQWLEQVGPPSAGRPAKIEPQDWLEAQLLRREAEELLKTKRSP
jgi:tetratricopeptide (TPR) repeat protein